MAQTTKGRSKKPGRARAEREPACPVGFCPVGMFLTVTGSARPEAVEHLIAAGREFILALTAILNTRVEDLGRPSQIEKVELE
jgi:hypothetical protein